MKLLGGGFFSFLEGWQGSQMVTRPPFNFLRECLEILARFSLSSYTVRAQMLLCSCRYYVLLPRFTAYLLLIILLLVHEADFGIFSSVRMGQTTQSSSYEYGKIKARAFSTPELQQKLCGLREFVIGCYIFVCGTPWDKFSTEKEGRHRPVLWDSFPDCLKNCYLLFVVITLCMLDPNYRLKMKMGKNRFPK
jgi:hypothetical protein